MKKIETMERDNGTMTMLRSERLNKTMYVVEYDSTPYINIFDSDHGNEAIQSLNENDTACQTRATSIPNYLLSDDTEWMFGVFCACFEAADGDISKAVAAMYENFSINGATEIWD